MSRSRVFSSLYGYKLHPDSEEFVCFWCSKPCAYTWDYTPHRHIGANANVIKQLGVDLYATPACKQCIAKSTYRKDQLFTIFEKRAFFEANQHASKYGEAMMEVIMQRAQVRLWQTRLETGQIVDKPDFELTSYELVAKQEWQRDQDRKRATLLKTTNPVPRTEDGSETGLETEASGDVHGAKSIIPSAEITETKTFERRATDVAVPHVSTDDDDFLGLNPK